MRNGVINSPRPAVNRYASGMTRRGVLSRARVAAKVRYLSVRIDVWSTCSAYTSLSLSLSRPDVESMLLLLCDEPRTHYYYYSRPTLGPSRRRLL